MSRGVVPGEIIVGDEPVGLFGDREVFELDVLNRGDRPVQVGSHFHFAEANEALEFDRESALGCRLAVPAGTSARFEPGIPMRVALVSFGGARHMAGFRGLHGGVV